MIKVLELEDNEQKRRIIKKLIEAGIQLNVKGISIRYDPNGEVEITIQEVDEEVLQANSDERNIAPLRQRKIQKETIVDEETKGLVSKTPTDWFKYLSTKQRVSTMQYSYKMGLKDVLDFYINCSGKGEEDTFNRWRLENNHVDSEYIEHLESEYESNMRYDYSDYLANGLLEYYLRVGNIDFVEKEFKNMGNRSLEYQRRFLLSTPNSEKLKEGIKDYVEGEKSRRESHGKTKIVSGSGRLLYEALCQESINEALVNELIDAGSDVDYEGYSNVREEYRNIVEYTPILMKALEIEDAAQRSRIIRSLISAGVKTDVKYVKIIYENQRRKLEEKKACDNVDLQTIMEELHQPLIKEDIPTFLRYTIKLTPQEILDVERVFQNYGRSIYEMDMETLKLQKNMLAAVNSVRQGFTSCARVLFLKPEVIYARLRFFEENGIIIEADRLYETLGCTNAAFSKKYGHMLLPEEEFDLYDNSNIPEVRRALLQRYKMPKK